MSIRFFPRPGGHQIAYMQRKGRSPGILFLPGLGSNMISLKGDALDRFASSQGLSYLRYDPFGHGSSSGEQTEATVARDRPHKIKALIGIASAPDCTRETIPKRMDKDQLDELTRGTRSYIQVAGGWKVTQNFLEEGEKHCVLDQDMHVDYPVRLLHGTEDVTVPPSLSKRLKDRMIGDDVQVKMIDGGDHRLSTPENLDILLNTIRKPLLLQ
ncbi:hypothetical protein PROFUN_04197 [Planoprotostelium fungivorum]|uniref:Serine aminopeptidase S33 domain-containing protein n=1 Tax=Planoprotostelium fungivorum TaxID=1890364 RepID=A0A2P6NW05_9EUKA|nr:hypothetical protein PROFUN_04197 [Planoprotostelium fungivorum]